jgi:hypothetical protein
MIGLDAVDDDRMLRSGLAAASIRDPRQVSRGREGKRSLTGH